jgi:phage-related protein
MPIFSLTATITFILTPIFTVAVVRLRDVYRQMEGNILNKLHTTYRAQMRSTARIELISLFRERGHGVRMTCTVIKFTDRRLDR